MIHSSSVRNFSIKRAVPALPVLMQSVQEGELSFRTAHLFFCAASFVAASLSSSLAPLLTVLSSSAAAAAADDDDTNVKANGSGQDGASSGVEHLPRCSNLLRHSLRACLSPQLLFCTFFFLWNWRDSRNPFPVRGDRAEHCWADQQLDLIWRGARRRRRARAGAVAATAKSEEDRGGATPEIGDYCIDNDDRPIYRSTG